MSPEETEKSLVRVEKCLVLTFECLAKLAGSMILALGDRAAANEIILCGTCGKIPTKSDPITDCPICAAIVTCGEVLDVVIPGLKSEADRGPVPH